MANYPLILISLMVGLSAPMSACSGQNSSTCSNEYSSKSNTMGASDVVKPQRVEEEQIPEEVVDELFPITQGYKTGFADKDGNIVIPCEYGGFGFFHEGMAAVKKKWWEVGIY